MPTAKQLICRSHPGGRFTPPKRKGRPPVRCDESYPCSARDTAIPTKPPRNAPKTTAAKELIAVGTDEGPTAVRTRIQRAFDGADASREKAKKAKAALIAKGWTVEGKGKGTQAEITAVRDEEMIFMMWDNGNLITSTYSLWAVDKPRDNSMPPTELPPGFDTDTMSDRELIAALSGMRVTWWNRLGQKREDAVVSTTRIAIEHVYEAETIKHGGAVPSQRIIKFADHEGKGFKAFYIGALIKVG
jgi:hypothetical protein